MTIILNVGDLGFASVVKRPSAFCKSPYVADIVLDFTDESVCAHSPSLGCKGMVDKDRLVLTTEKKQCKEDAICKYSIDFAFIPETQTIVGINPKYGEKIADSILKNHLLPTLKPVKLEREKTYHDSRFDFHGFDQNNVEFYLEVKSVPLAYKEQNTAYFPDGYRKKKGDPISPRALKHLETLISIKQNTSMRAILMFVIQRNDVQHFSPSKEDPIYLECFQRAMTHNVEIIPVKVSWDLEGNCRFLEAPLPIVIPEIV